MVRNSSRSSKPNFEDGTGSCHPSTGTVRSGSAILLFMALISYASWSVYYYQFENLPPPLSAEESGKRGFSEVEALVHVKELTRMGPHPVGSDALDLAVQYVLTTAEKIKKAAHWEVDVELDLFHANSGSNPLLGGTFKGKTIVYSDLNHVVLRFLPKYVSEAGESAILVSSHVDTVFSTAGAGDCSSCVAVMLELARGISQWAHGLKNGIIFLFNTGEEEGLNGAHSFITQHPWSKTIRLAIDLESMGVGGKSGIFQVGPHPWAVENFASAAKYPSGLIAAQDFFSSGVLKSATDFQVYKEIAGLSGLDFAFTDNTAVYHTKNDKLEMLKPGSLQHLGENMLAFLLQIASASHIPHENAMEEEGKTAHDSAIFFDILGKYMIVLRQNFASILYNSVIAQSLLIWATSLFMGGYQAVISLFLSCLSAILMWLFSLGFSVAVAFSLSAASSFPLPYVSSPMLVVGLFASPALLGALAGQHLGFLILQKFLLSRYCKKKKLSSAMDADLIKLEAERWLFKSGFLQWMLVLVIGNYYRIGSSYLALVWLVPPAFAYGLLEATLTPSRSPRPLKLATLFIGLSVPILVSAGVFIRFAVIIIGFLVRFDRNPGGTPEWLGNVLVSIFVAAIFCLTLVYILSYVHLSGAKRPIVLATSVVLGISLISVLSGVPSFTEHIARTLNVVHVVDATGRDGQNQSAMPSSYISLFSLTPGTLAREADEIDEGFACGADKAVDFVTFSVRYGCWSSSVGADEGWSETDVPALSVVSDTKESERVTRVSLDTKTSLRWSLGVNTQEIEDFSMDEGNSEQLVPFGYKGGDMDGWHVIQFSGGKKAPRKFDLTLIWRRNSSVLLHPVDVGPTSENKRLLLKLRTDNGRLTRKTKRVLSKFPPWCSTFGKSTLPLTLAFLADLPVDFST